jgi:hypothetical protein
MDTTLVTVTLLSLTMAAGLSAIVWRLLRDERRRSDARVAALTTMAARPAARIEAPAFELPLHERPRVAGTVRRDAGASPSKELFVEREAASPWGHRVAVMAGLALVLATAVLLSLMASGRLTRHSPTPASAATALSAAKPAAAIGLELLSLRDSRQPGSLNITGLVENPRGGAVLAHVSVTAYAFDDKGAFVASGHAPIDVGALAPGDQSPFVVSVPVTETVARYRIGFRGEDGRVIAHIDRRQQSPVALLRQGPAQENR